MNRISLSKIVPFLIFCSGNFINVLRREEKYDVTGVQNQQVDRTFLYWFLETKQMAKTEPTSDTDFVVSDTYAE